MLRKLLLNLVLFYIIILYSILTIYQQSSTFFSIVFIGGGGGGGEGGKILINSNNKMEVIVKTFQCYIIVYPHATLFVSKFQYNISMQSIGTPYLNMGFLAKTLTGD